jgi:hypothetical protein
LCPAKYDQIGLQLLGGDRNDFFPPARPPLQANAADAPGAVPGQEVARPALVVLRLVVDVQSDDLDLGAVRELDQRARSE